jgi:phage shock protein C
MHKLREGRIIDGVCGGFARYLGIDSIWVRVGWALLALAGGIGILAYLLGMYFFPRSEGEDAEPPAHMRKSASTLVAGLALIGVGILIVLRAIGVLHYGFWGAWHVAWTVLWPMTLIGGGLLLLFVYWRQNVGGSIRFRRPGWDKMVLGVCGGLGETFRIDPNVVRFAFALLIVLTRGLGLIVYLVVALLTPEAKDETEGA